MKKNLYICLFVAMIFSLISCNNNNNNNNQTNNNSNNYGCEFTLFNEDLAYAYGYDEDRNKKMGYFDQNGNIVIDFKYKYASGFVNNKAIVSLDGNKFFFINKNDEQISNSFDSIDYDYNNSIYEVKIDNKCCILNKDGDVISSDYDYIGNFNDGFAVVKNDFKYGYINLLGKEVKATTLDYAGAFFNENAVIIENGIEKVINKNFNVIFETNYGESISVAQKDYVIVRNNDELKVYDYNGMCLVKNNDPYSNSFARENYFSINGTIYSKTGEMLFSGYKEYQILCEYVILKVDNNKYVVYDYEFNKIYEFNYNEYCWLSEYEEDNYRGNVYIEIRTENYNEFYVIKNKKVERLTFLDKYKSIEDIFMNYLLVLSDNGYGLLDLEGNIIYPATNDYRINATDDGYFVYNNSNRESIVETINSKKLIVSKEIISICFTSKNKN